MILRRLALLLFVAFFSMHSGCAAIQEYMEGSGGSQMTTEKVVRGLVEALNVGSKRAVDTTSQENGFLNNPLIRINTPQQLQVMMNALKTIGFSQQVANFEVQMNRAAETASKEALNVFVDVIRGITFQDAWGILQGDATAATTYFKDRSTSVLADRFRPIVRDAMHKVGLYSAYEVLSGAYARLPMSGGQTFDLETYIVDKALSGLFTTLGQEESKIRANIQSRTSPILQEVFGYLDAQRSRGQSTSGGSTGASTGSGSSTTPTGTISR